MKKEERLAKLGELLVDTLATFARDNNYSEDDVRAELNAPKEDLSKWLGREKTPAVDSHNARAGTKPKFTRDGDQW